MSATPEKRPSAADRWWALYNKRPWSNPFAVSQGDFVTEIEAAENAAVELAACEIPTNWCDPLLTGAERAVKDSPPREIEALLRGIQDRIRSLKASAAPPPQQVSESTTEDRVSYLRRDVEDLRAARELLNDAIDKLAQRVTGQTATLAGLIERVAAVEWVNQKIPPNPIGPSFRYTDAPVPRAASEVERATEEIVTICRAARDRSRMVDYHKINACLARLDAAKGGAA